MGFTPGPPQFRVLQPHHGPQAVPHPAVHIMGKISSSFLLSTSLSGVQHAICYDMILEFSFGVKTRRGFVNLLISPQIFYLPMALVAPPAVFAVHIQLNLLYQFWIHTEVNLSKLVPDSVISWMFVVWVTEMETKICVGRNCLIASSSVIHQTL